MYVLLILHIIWLKSSQYRGWGAQSLSLYVIKFKGKKVCFKKKVGGHLKLNRFRRSIEHFIIYLYLHLQFKQNENFLLSNSDFFPSRMQCDWKIKKKKIEKEIHASLSSISNNAKGNKIHFIMLNNENNDKLRFRGRMLLSRDFSAVFITQWQPSIVVSTFCNSHGVAGDFYLYLTSFYLVQVLSSRS